MDKLPRSFYDRDTVLVARELLGKHLVHASGGVERVGRIVEAEAYLGPHDLAAHSARGLNVVTQPEGVASAVLLRALEPVKDIQGRTQGPGLLCKAMGIDKRLNGHDLLSDDFFIASPDQRETFTIVKRPRVGVGYAGVWAKRLLRFYIKGNSFVSRP
jgi:DNA-3-methyladenine glycosylase